MDATTEQLVDFALESEFSSLSQQTIHECKRRLVDTFASAFGAYDEPLTEMTRSMARLYSGGPGPGARVWGSAWKTAPEAAAFSNGVMLRFQELNDQYGVKSRGHPSDVIAGVLAVGEAVNANGKDVINAVTLAYDIFCSFCDSVDAHSKGWDQPLMVVMACALAAGKLMGLSRTQMGHALSLALVPNLPLNQTRFGELSNWKACSAANAARNAVYAAILAQTGFTGPSGIFEGKYGLFSIVGRFDWQLSAARDRPHSINNTNIKYFPAGYHAQGAAWAALELRGKVDITDIKTIEIETYDDALNAMAGDPTRWSPKTRETADHSMPFVVATALLDGAITPKSYSEKRLVNPKILDLIGKTKIAVSEEINARYPKAAPCKMKITTFSGQTIKSEILSPRGHGDNPLSDDDLSTKFSNLFGEYADEGKCKAALDGIWNMDRGVKLSNLLDLLVVDSNMGMIQISK